VGEMGDLGIQASGVRPQALDHMRDVTGRDDVTVKN
jgi:hypothetical protein